MPVYDYKCPEHGIFHELATLEDFDKPSSCPQCQKMSPRVIIMSPEILDMAPEKRQAMQKNEIARHEPHFSTQDTRLENAERRKYKCGCSHHDRQEKRSSKLFYTAEGNKMFPSMRPWMISH